MTHLFRIVNKKTLFIVLLDFEITFSDLSKILSFKDFDKVIVDYGFIHIDDSFRFVEFPIVNEKINLSIYKYVSNDEYATMGNELIFDYKFHKGLITEKNKLLIEKSSKTKNC